MRTHPLRNNRLGTRDLAPPSSLRLPVRVRTQTGRFVASSLALFLLCGAARAGEAASQSAASQSPAAQRLQQMSTVLRSAQRLSVEVTIDTEVNFRGRPQRSVARFAVSTARPNKFSMVLQEGEGSTIVCDGAELIVYDPKYRQYIQRPAPAELEKIFESTEGAAGLFGDFLLPLIATDPYEHIMQSAEGLQDLGTKSILNTECNGIAILEDPQRGGVPWKVWLRGGDLPLPRKIVPDVSQALAQRLPPGATIDIQVSFDRWRLNPDLAPDHFSFVPPSGAVRIDSMLGPRHHLQGRRAPNIRLTTLDGDTFDLSKHKGKQIVVIDFWASWCGPCIMAMQYIERLAQGYDDKDVVFYSINSGESVARARRFVNRHQLGVAVPMDLYNRAGRKYRVDSLPSIFVIGRDGKIQLLFTGFHPLIIKQIDQNLKLLLAEAEETEQVSTSQ